MFDKKKDVYEFGEKKEKKKFWGKSSSEKADAAEITATEPTEKNTALPDCEPTEEAAEENSEENTPAKKPRFNFTKPDIKKLLRDRKKLGIVLIVSSLLVLVVIAPLLNLATANEMATAVVLTEDVKKGQVIESSILTTADVPAAALLPIHISDKDMAVGKYARSDMVKGEPVSEIKLSPTMPFDDSYLYDLPEGKKAMSVELLGLASSISGKLMAGDIISIYSSINSGSSEGVTSADLAAELCEELEYVKVLAAVNADGFSITETTEKSTLESPLVNTAILLVDDAQARLLAGMASKASIRAALVYRGEELGGKYLEMQDNINKSEAVK